MPIRIGQTRLSNTRLLLTVFTAFVNGKFRKDPKLATANDFFSGLNIPRNTRNRTNAVAIAALSSQNPGVITNANAVVGSNPPINPDVLTKAFRLGKNVVSTLHKQLGGNK
ncbi:hypothetical protein POTOM_058986 [Populus tomentosa]|uniref:Cupin type-1 domain-containing protein n=1 Tax=Populus tomentosa TaxID=118781 RepID=A0A8X8BZJ7_POPTO|nr:hypothetical protein POTOM_058986 [Populus tomentosa]